jgi:hypothetical protein
MVVAAGLQCVRMWLLLQQVYSVLGYGCFNRFTLCADVWLLQQVYSVCGCMAVVSGLQCVYGCCIRFTVCDGCGGYGSQQEVCQLGGQFLTHYTVHHTHHMSSIN